ncbi:MAG: DUF835 domain-containing protein [Euryarchaeota archaeon]|nr:DUF835 domain-containing protein [Euryarchaeota archaeon]
MVELSPLAPAFIVLALSKVTLGSYVLMKGRLSPVNRYFFLLTLLAGAGSVLDLMVASLGSERQAALAFRVLVFMLIIEMGVAYRLSTMVPHTVAMPLFGSKRWAYEASVTSVALAMSLSVGGMVSDQYGWVPDSELPFAALTVLLIAYLALLLTTLHRRWGGLKGLLKRQAVLFTCALAVPAVVMIGTMALSTAGFPRIHGLGELVSVAAVAYGIVRYQLFIPPRVNEEVVLHRPVPSLAKGRAYLFEMETPDRMFESAVHEMNGGMSAFFIARTHPDQLRARYRLTHTPIIWLATTPGPDRVNPSNVQMLMHMTTEFVRRAPSVIALEGLEYLMVNNDLNRVLKFLGQLRDEVIVEGSILLVAVDARTLTDRQRAILERELEVIKE